MDSTRKLWLLILLGACILMLQYHVSTTWNSPGMSGPSYSGSSSAEEVVESVVSKLQLDSAMVNAVGRKYLREVALQIGRELLSTKNCDYSLSPTSGWPEPTLYIITPTYRRPEQLAEMTRMAQTLMHVRNLVWLVIEDANSTTESVTKLLDRSGIEYHHLIAPMPEQYRKKKVKPRGVSNRNRGLEWIRANATKGVLYFADDDNTYDISLFQEIRTTKKVSMFPVGLCTKFGVSTPIVKNGTFAGFYDGWIGGRKFPVDMAGFAINLDFLFKRPKATMPYKPGFEEDGFLRSLSPFEPKEVELKADNCTKVRRFRDPFTKAHKWYLGKGVIKVEMTWLSQFLTQLVKHSKRFIHEFVADVDLDVDKDSYQILNKLLYVFAPLLTAVVFYQYTKYMLIFNAFQYEKSVRKRCGHLKKLTKQLKVLMKHYGNFYFRFLPMNHGRTLPRTYTLFTAIKEVLMNSNRPGKREVVMTRDSLSLAKWIFLATRGVRTNLLFDLIRGNAHYTPQYLSALELNLRNRYDDMLGEVDPLSEYNLDIMKCCREMIIQGIKDFEVMSTVYRVLETVMED